MGQSLAIFVYFHSFLILITISIIQIEKSIDGVLGIRSWGRRMVGKDETTELWRHPPKKYLNFATDFSKGKMAYRVWFDKFYKLSPQSWSTCFLPYRFHINYATFLQCYLLVRPSQDVFLLNLIPWLKIFLSLSPPWLGKRSNLDRLRRSNLDRLRRSSLALYT